MIDLKFKKVLLKVFVNSKLLNLLTRALLLLLKKLKEIENLNLETLLMIILTIVFTLISVKFVLLSAKITKNFLVLEGTVLLVLVTIVLNYINVSWTSISTKLNLLMVIISIL